jgi:hypothetical protein
MPASGASPPTVTELTTNTQIAGAASIGADPVGGNPFYIPKLGESAFLHFYDSFNKLVEPTISVWTSTEALSQYSFDWDKALHSKEWLAAPHEKKHEVARALIKPLEELARRKGDLIALPDMTRVKVLGYGTFAVPSEANHRRQTADDEWYLPLPDGYFVEVSEGQYVGKKGWAQCYSVRVPDSKPFKPIFNSQVSSGGPTIGEQHTPTGKNEDDKLSDEPDQSIQEARENASRDQDVATRALATERLGRKTAPAEVPAPANAKVVLTDLASEPIGYAVKISGRFQNTSDEPLKGTFVDISVEDRAGKLLQSFTCIGQPDTIEPGERGSFQAVLLENDSRAAGVKLDFRTFKQAIPWVDRSSKDAHP